MYKLSILNCLFLSALMVSCAGTNENKRNSDIVVTYEGKVVHKAGPSIANYSSFADIESLVQSKSKKYIIFMADWCKSCKFLNNALYQAEYNEKVHKINSDELWVQSLAKSFGISAVPTMIVVDKDNNIEASFVGPSKIVMHLLVNID